MKPFPTTFASSISLLSPDMIEPPYRAALISLIDKGFEIQLGLTNADIPGLQALSTETSVRKYCPRDCTERFKDEPTIREWFKKERLVFLLKETASSKLAGIAWTGPGTSPHIHDGKLTGGVRLSEHFQGLGLATPFLTVILHYTRQEYSSDLLWYECWESNTAAVHIYKKLGFVVVGIEPGKRLNTDGSLEPDKRLFMEFRPSHLTI